MSRLARRTTLGNTVSETPEDLGPIYSAPETPSYFANEFLAILQFARSNGDDRFPDGEKLEQWISEYERPLNKMDWADRDFRPHQLSAHASVKSSRRKSFRGYSFPVAAVACSEQQGYSSSEFQAVVSPKARCSNLAVPEEGFAPSRRLRQDHGGNDSIELSSETDTSTLCDKSELNSEDSTDEDDHCERLIRSSNHLRDCSHSLATSEANGEGSATMLSLDQSDTSMIPPQNGGKLESTSTPMESSVLESRLSSVVTFGQGSRSSLAVSTSGQACHSPVNDSVLSGMSLIPQAFAHRHKQAVTGDSNRSTGQTTAGFGEPDGRARWESQILKTGLQANPRGNSGGKFISYGVANVMYRDLRGIRDQENIDIEECLVCRNTRVEFPNERNEHNLNWIQCEAKNPRFHPVDQWFHVDCIIYPRAAKQTGEPKVSGTGKRFLCPCCSAGRPRGAGYSYWEEHIVYNLLREFKYEREWKRKQEELWHEIREQMYLRFGIRRDRDSVRMYWIKHGQYKFSDLNYRNKPPKTLSESESNELANLSVNRTITSLRDKENYSSRCTTTTAGYIRKPPQKRKRECQEEESRNDTPTNIKRGKIRQG